MLHRNTPRPWYAAAMVLAMALGTAAAPALAQQGSGTPPGTTAAPAAAPAAGQSRDSARQPAHKSRFGRFGRVLGRAADAAQSAAAQTGVSKATAAHLAITAATGGVAAAVLSAREPGAAGTPAMAAKVLASRRLTGAPSLAATGVDTATASAALRAMQELGSISARAQQHDPAAVHAMQVLSAAMAKPDAGFVALQRRATAGDPTAAQQMMIREADIVRAALGGARP